MYDCAVCDKPFPGGAKGSTFLVKPDGRTDHLCSHACLAAHVNSEPRPVPATVICAVMMAGTLILHAFLSFISVLVH